MEEFREALHSADTRRLRFHDRTLVMKDSPTIPGACYFEMEKKEGLFVDGMIFKETETRIDINVYD
ncbi:MAG: hypothetical protein DRN95_09045 [Candidatus Hydrothermarchaeota archaeon]|nr:MAG: hypothetical protein DRN95_09045 [Candidatus Hydrothermarchaeota archaeon]